ncbi:hypothetical protein DPMN_129505 [Dreissena polymorpha]|uniref:Uncharacterized protein n=1 Tax=Dreissena polymorpha TaxID=45954 RepID=A0A9D4K136_DREPO|nr:hypothetical protein DPMN_129505 [Dreissena polymorpha]
MTLRQDGAHPVIMTLIQDGSGSYRTGLCPVIINIIQDGHGPVNMALRQDGARSNKL